MAPHHDPDQHAGKRAIVEVQSHERLRDKTGSRAEPGAVVVYRKVVIDRLRNVHGAKIIAGRIRLLIDDSDGVRRVISADVKEIPDVVLLHDFKHAGAILLVRLVAGRHKS